MEKFLSDQRVLAFFGAVFMGIGGWIIGFQHWSEMLTPAAFGGLLGILGGILLANVTSNVLKTPPTITETTVPLSQVTVTTTTTTPPEASK
jgi:hypothetical protein